MSENTDKRTATQRIEDLESVVANIYQTMLQHKNVMEGLLGLKPELNMVKEALQLLNKKSEAIIQAATPETGITTNSVSDLVVKMNVLDLQAQVASYVQNGHLATAEQVAADSYLVCEESDESGVVVNPRIQFRLDTQDEAANTALAGKKVGDTVSFGEGKLNAKILEIYSITEPKTAEAAAAEATAAEAPATESTATAAPAETQAQSLASPNAPAAELPTESPVGFELQYHGQPESTLTSPETASA